MEDPSETVSEVLYLFLQEKLRQQGIALEDLSLAEYIQLVAQLLRDIAEETQRRRRVSKDQQGPANAPGEASIPQAASDTGAQQEVPRRDASTREQDEAAQDGARSGDADGDAS
ncbi:MAG: hypothetical protein GXO36_04820 [Chloroflexi bacterium]|nr:hypothetical protein [Chloroflexota bacterium]